MMTTECNKCIHEKVCGLKEKVKIVESKVIEGKIEQISCDIAIQIRCIHYDEKLNKSSINYRGEIN